MSGSVVMQRAASSHTRPSGVITVAKIREAGRVLGSLRMGIPLDILLALIALFLIPRYWPLVLQP